MEKFQLYKGFYANSGTALQDRRGVSLIIVMLMAGTFVLFIAGMGGMIANHAVTGLGLEDASSVTYSAEGGLERALTGFLHENWNENISPVAWDISGQGTAEISAVTPEVGFEGRWDISSTALENEISRDVSVSINTDIVPVFSSACLTTSDTTEAMDISDVHVYNNNMYVAVSDGGSNGPGLYIYTLDGSGIPASPEVGFFSMVKANGVAVFQAGATVEAYVSGSTTDADGVFRLNVTDATNPIRSEVITGAMYTPAAAAASVEQKLFIYSDYSRGTDTAEISLYCAMGTGGLKRISLSPNGGVDSFHFKPDDAWTAPTVIPAECYSVYIWGDTMEVAAGSLGIVRINIPADVVQNTVVLGTSAGTYLPSGTIMDISIRHNVAYLAAAEGGFRAIDLQDNSEIIMPSAALVQGLYLEREVVWAASPGSLTRFDKPLQILWTRR